MLSKVRSVSFFSPIVNSCLGSEHCTFLNYFHLEQREKNGNKESKPKLV